MRPPDKTRLLVADARNLPLPDEHYHAVITSPPYYQRRDYLANPNQIGQEPYLDCLGWTGNHQPCQKCYICHIIQALADLARVTRNDGTIVVNLADNYKDRDHQAIPQRVIMAAKLALHLVLVAELPWIKENPQPDPASTRPGVSTESLIVFAKTSNYYWDNLGAASQAGITRNFRNGDIVQVVQTYNNAGYNGDHDASFPPMLVRPLIIAAASQNGCCPTCGAPMRRQVEKTFIPQDDHPTAETLYRARTPGNNWHGSRRGRTLYRTLDWKRSCHHQYKDPTPCRILDPFGGTGALAIAADPLPYSVTLTDINRPYLTEQAATRLNQEAPASTGVQLRMFSHA